MPVTLVTTPDPFALTKGGRMLYEFSGSGRLATKGVNATSVLFVSKAVAPGTTLTLHWNGTDHTLLFVNAPAAPNEFTAGDGSRTYVRALLLELRTYFPIREDFSLTEYDPTQLAGIVLTAKKPGPAYDITVNFPVNTPFALGNGIFGGLPIIRPQYSIYSEIWLQKQGTTGDDLNADYERIFSPIIECDESGSAQFDVGNVLHSRLSADFPTWHLPQPALSQFSARKYFVCYGEAYGSPVKVGKVLQDDVRVACLGGVDYMHRAGGGLSLLSIHPARKALRLGELTRFVRPDEPQFLSFLNSDADQPASRLNITRIFDNDATDAIKTATLVAQDVPMGRKITYSVGPAQLDLLDDLPAGRSLREYTVQRFASDGVTTLSEVYRYILNYDYQLYTRYFGYLNSLGCIETLATFGKGSSELNRFFEQAEQYLPAFYEIADGQFADYNVSVQQTVEVATGFRSEAELQSWNDFYRSPSRFRLADGRALPISITAKSIQQAKDGDTLFAHKFSYTYSYKDDFFSEEPTSTSAPAPIGFVGAGGATITLQPTQVVIASDPTVPDAVRGLSATIINKFNQAVAWGNHALAGYLNQTTASLLFRRKDQPISYPELINKPTTRDEAGLTDVPTRADITKLIHVQAHLTAWSTEQDPPQL